MSKKKRSLLSTLAAQMTAMVSVALVLIVIGVMAIGGVAAHSLSSELRQRMGFTVIMSDDVPADTVRAVLRRWRTEPAVATYRYVSPTKALERWQEATGDDEDLVALLGANPFRHEMEVNVRPAYANVDSLRQVMRRVSAWPGVAEVRMQARMIQAINDTITRGALILGGVAVALLVISVVLINNMVRLTIYSRRFVINTMKLVGATAGFIRRPFVVASLVNGMLSGAVALVVLGSIMAYGYASEAPLTSLVPVPELACVLGGVFVLGLLICGLSSLFATNRYLRLDHDDLYR
ncbi:MAG: permease-like cell division protein FtsX [Candidatus Amulumruptor caecigallinarius]|nr:permease-like cell division protein FtsX [Candidatus Amulumruptor caecigallinarius]MCM1396922.1 permease-like cell division protein FtsX [Candidatus Amulumruptor caecigallinarius]MCM1454134.1 permease-like cell division protein FtsX [bacterium]